MSENSDGTAPKLIPVPESDLTPEQQRIRQEALCGKGFNGQPERFTAQEDGSVVVDNPGARWHLLSLKHAIRLEGLGMRHSSGRSALKHAKDVYGLKGNREAVLKQIDDLLEELRQAAIAEQF